MSEKNTDDSLLDRLLREAANEPRLLSPQTKLYHGRFVLKRLLGSGGMGAVYEAKDTRRGNIVALKTLLSVNSSAIYRLKQEFRSLADLVHPNLVGLHELFFDDKLNQWFFTMDFVPGDPLLERLDSPADEAYVRGAYCQLARGIQAIHSRGKLHRDIKPSNVLITEDDLVVILDFGLVSDQHGGGVGQTATEDSASGTPLYMSPEQGAGEPASVASDWYSFGVMLFEALAARPPFIGPGAKVLMRKQNEDAPLLSAVRPGVARDLESLTKRLLSRSPDARPTFEEIAAVLDVAGPTTQTSENTEQGVFIGRQDELSALQVALEATDSGRPEIVFVEGNSGIGKTALVEQFLRNLRRQSKTVILTGRCYERESVPYKACDSIVDALSRYLKKVGLPRAAAMLPKNVHALARIFPVLERLKVVRETKLRHALPADPVELRRAGFGALKELLLRIAQQEPLVLFLDDLQWTDVDSAVLLSSLFAPPNPPPLLLVGAYRSDEIEDNPGLSALHDQLRVQKENAVTKIVLGPLSINECRTLAHGLLSSDFEKQVSSIAREAQGNPFFVKELSRFAASDPSRALSLDASIANRISSLGDSQRELLEAVCVSARPVGRELLELVVAASDIDRCIRELLAQQLVRYHRGFAIKLTCYHDRIRTAVVSHLTESRCEAWHRRFAGAIERQAEPDLTALTEHYLGAKEFSKAGDRAIDVASHAAETLAFGKAVEMYRTAIAHAEVGESQRIELRIELAQALANGMRSAEAGREYLDISARVSPEQRGEFRRKGAEQLLFSGRVDEGLTVLKEVFEDNGLDYDGLHQQNPFESIRRLEASGFEYSLRSVIDPVDLRHLDIMWAAGHGTNQLKEDEAIFFLTAHAEMALEVGEPVHVARALAIMSMYNSFFGKEANPALTRLRQLRAERTEPIIAAWLDLAVANDAFWFGRFNESITVFERAESVLIQECTGVARELSAARLVNALAYSYLLDMNAIWSVCTRWLGEAQENENIHLSASFISAIADRWIVADRTDVAVRELEELLAQLPDDTELMTLLNANMLLALCESYQGDLKGWERMDTTTKQFESSLYCASPMLKCTFYNHRGIVAIALAHKHPEPEKLLSIAESDARIVENPTTMEGKKVDMPYWRSLGMLMHAGVAAARGDRNRSLEILDETLDLMAKEKDTNRLAEESARCRKGQLIGGKGGDEIRDESIAALRRGGVQNPARWNAYIAPGFDTLLK